MLWEHIIGRPKQSLVWIGGIGICQERKGGRAFWTERQTNLVSYSLGWSTSRAGIASDSYLGPFLPWGFDKCFLADSQAASEQSGDSVPVALTQESSPWWRAQKVKGAVIQTGRRESEPTVCGSSIPRKAPAICSTSGKRVAFFFICPPICLSISFLVQYPHPHPIRQFNSILLRVSMCAKLGIWTPI